MAYQPKHMRSEKPAAAPATTQSQPAPKEELSTQEQVGRNAALMSVFVMVSRLTGFFRTWGQAYAIGVTVMASCYTIANNLPNQLYELVVAGMLTTAFLPVYLSAKKRLGREGASDYASNLVSIVLVLMGAVAILGFVFASQLIYTQSFTANEDFDFDLAVYFFRFFVIDVVLYALSSIFSGLLNAERDYLWSSAAPIFNNFVTTTSYFLYAFLVNIDPQVALLVLALGNPLGVAIQVLVQLPAVRKRGIRLRPKINLHDPLLKETLKLGIPSFAVVIASFVTTSVQSSSSLSVVATGASITYYARLWYTLPYSILTVPITTAMFTELSDSWAKDDHGAFRRGITSGVGQILFFMIPFMLYLAVFSIPLISVLAAGKFSADALDMTASYLAVYAVSLPFYAVYMYLQKVASAMRRMVLCAVANAIAAVVQVVALLTLTPVFGLNFVAFSSTLFFCTLDIVMCVSLRASLGSIGLRSVAVSMAKTIVLALLGAGVGALVLFALNTYVGDCTGQAMRSVLYCALAGIPALLVTYGGAFAIKMPETAMLQRLLRRFVRR